ncbi:MAG: T9SS C-terminal target domain-containing protein, partial [Bacteroidetes bacterium]
PIPDITLYAAVASDTVIDLGNVFDDPDDPGAGIGKSIISMTDPSLLGASIEGDVLGISYAMAGNEQGGTTDMVVEAVSGGLSVTDTFNITLVPLSGARPARFALDIFPNPGNGRFMIETGMGEPVTVAIYGLTGNLVFSMDRYMPGGMIDLGRRPAGSYLVRIRGRNGTLSGMIHITGQN